MLPLDYYWLDKYELEFDSWVQNLVSKVNNWETLETSEIERLKNEKFMVQFLILLEVEKNGEQISLQKLKQKRHDEKHRNMMSWESKDYLDKWANEARSLNRSMESASRKQLSQDEVLEKTWVEAKKYQEFHSYLETKFKPLVEKIFESDITFWVYERSWWESKAVDYWFNGDGIYFNFNSEFISKHVSQSRSDTIELVTHELTHLLEDKSSFWSHQKDLEHDNSFEKIQRGLLRSMLRML